MQRPQNERIKSVNLLAHLAPERRRNKPTYNTPTPSVSEDIQPKMVHEPKKIETGILVGLYIIIYYNTTSSVFRAILIFIRQT